MNKESLIKAREKIIDILDNSNIPNEDKVELLINLYHFLDPDKYNRNIKTLSSKLTK